MQRCLGRIVPLATKLAFLPKFAASAAMAQLPDPPRQVILTEAVATPTYAGTLGNTRAGCCTISGLLRCQQSWSARARGKPISYTDEQALAVYSSLSGYDPATGANDTGLVETDVLDYWAKSGVYGDVLAGYSSIEVSNIRHVKQAIDLYGATYLGLNLPESAEQQTAAGQPWTLPWFSRQLGGHCVPAFEYDDYYVYVGTWGDRQPVAWDFYLRYFDAAYAPADPLWIGPDGKTPGGLDLSGLTADLNYVAN